MGGAPPPINPLTGLPYDNNVNVPGTLIVQNIKSNGQGVTGGGGQQGSSALEKILLTLLGLRKPRNRYNKRAYMGQPLTVADILRNQRGRIDESGHVFSGILDEGKRKKIRKLFRAIAGNKRK